MEPKCSLLHSQEPLSVPVRNCTKHSTIET